MLRFTRKFHFSAARRLAVGDSVPSALLQIGSPSETLNLADATKSGKFVVIGVPGAFSPGCSQRHVPEYLKNFADFQKKGVDHIYVVAVNDSFVTGAWKDALFGAVATPGAEKFVTIAADPSGEFSRDWDVLFDASKFFGNRRSQRYAAVIENGKVVKANAEPDSTGINDSEASKIINQV